MFAEGNAFAFAISIAGWFATQAGLAWRYSMLRKVIAPRAKPNWLSILLFSAQSLMLFALFAPPWRFGDFAWMRTTQIEVGVVSALSVLGVAFFFGGLLGLGANFAANAQVREGGALVTSGAYSIVRNPIYLGYFLLYVASGLGLGDLRRLALCAGLFLLLTCARILVEERVLRSHFGPDFDAYARRVKRLVPLIW